MAITITPYNHTAKKLLDLSLVDEAANVYVMLVDGTTAFDASHTTLDQATDSGADEVSGYGWTAGGENLANVAVTTVTTNDTKLDCDDVSVTATGGSISATDAIIYVDEGGAGTTKSPLWFIDFDGTIVAPDGATFALVIDGDGLLSSVFS